MNRRSKGFSLIELLIVVAIVAILAAIAVPNFLEAQTRSKVSKVRADFRALATGLESYASDWDHYPLSYAIGNDFGTASIDRALFAITTPVAYMSTITYYDPFGQKTRRVENLTSPNHVGSRPMYMYFNYEILLPSEEAGGTGYGYGNQPEWAWHAAVGRDLDPSHRAFMMWGPGPDRTDNNLYWAETVGLNSANNNTFCNIIYDPSNGTVSRGDMGRLGGAYQFKVPLYY